MTINFWYIFIFLFLIIFSLFLSDFLKKKKEIHPEILRKIPHILIGILFSLTPFFITKNEIIILSIILLFGIFIKKYFSFFNSIFLIERNTYGIWFWPISLGIMAFLWLPENIENIENILPFIFGMLILTFSDTSAAIFGQFLGKKKFLKSTKTYVGSLFFFITTFIILFLTSKNINLFHFFLISSTLTFLEIILIYGLDNLFLPIIASYLFYFLL